MRSDRNLILYGTPGPKLGPWVREGTMKTILGFAAAVALTWAAIPAAAGDGMWALSTIPAGERAGLTPLSDAQLGLVQGQEGFLDDLLLQPFLHPLFGLWDPAMLAALGQTSSGRTHHSAHTQQNRGGGLQTNITEVRQH